MLPTEPLDFIDHPAFALRNARAKFGLTELPALPPARHFDLREEREADSYVMSQEEEAQRFQEYNYAKRAYNRSLKDKAKSAQRNWNVRQLHLREYLIRVNTPLVYSQIARNLYRYSCLDFHDAISAGLDALWNAVDGFDVQRGFKFSTYACQSILRNLSSLNTRAAKRKSRLQTVEMPESYGEIVDQTQSVNDNIEVVRNVLRRNLAGLTDVEMTVLRFRFELGDVERHTLEEIGTLIGVSKERVRQIQEKALEKLRRVVHV